MNRLHSILTALALATVPCVGAVAIRALWEIPEEVSSTSLSLRATLAGTSGVETHANDTIDLESRRFNQSLDTFDSSLETLDRQVATIGPAVRRIDPALDNITDDTYKLGRTIDLFNAPCAPAPCGAIANLNKTMATVRGTFGQVEVAANHEDRNLDTLDAQEAALFADFHGTATRANTSLDTFNGLLANPNVTLMMANGGKFTTTAVAVEQKLAQCTLHPTLPCVLRSDILFGAQVGGYLLK
jgi:ABC-type transporter Mla subunit MlaD